jgi:UDP-N-acetylmuramoyl-L-alanyl-D-glutamate--2,6-diaminopimelate ligase
MRLSHILQAVDHVRSGEGDPEILAVTHDSRRVRPGTLFAAFQGQKHDGRGFIPAAVAAGAAAVLAEGAAPAGLTVPFVGVSNARRGAALTAARLAGDPAAHLVMVGVTGTSGKTTTTILVERMLSDALGETGLFGTIAYHGAGGAVSDAARTTPEATELQPMLGALVRAGAKAAVMECSSHAIHLERLAGCRFDAAVFTNLSRDHLDYHRDLDDYFEAKSRLFGMLKPGGAAIVNADDPWGARLLAQLRPDRAFGFTLRGATHAKISGDATIGPEGTTVDVRAPVRFSIVSRLLGAPNAENLLAAAAVGLALGLPPDGIARSLGSVDTIPGRLESIPNGLGITALVDYAHKPGALERVLETCRGLAAASGRVIAVFGCGGDRDRGKRPEMGRIAALFADEVILTADNPRSEDPAAITAEIEAGVRETGRRATVEIDRATAISRALARARPGDVVLIAGKGHEQYQEVGGDRRSFDERAIARAALEALETERSGGARGA